METKLNEAEIAEFLEQVFPQVRGEFVIEEVRPLYARVRMSVSERHLRPGGTISGPSMFGLADVSFYIATLAMIGREALTVTTNLNINFLRKPEPVDLIGEARILKFGKLLATGDVTIYSQGSDRPVAHATTTYAIPPKKEAPA
ncbi:MAG: PaaI family thioesterase [Pseudomonadota bacterium]